MLAVTRRPGVALGALALAGLALAAPAAAQPAAPAGRPVAQPAGDAGAAPAGGRASVGGHAPYRLNLRLGGATTEAPGVPTVCGELRLWRRLSVEGCGTGAELWRTGGGPEMMHVRALWEVAARAAGGGRAALRLGAGFAELAIDADQPGLEFGDPDAAAPVAVAGPEAAVSAQWTVPLAGGVEFVGTATAGAAYLPGAPRLAAPRDRAQPFASLELGLGW